MFRSTYNYSVKPSTVSTVQDINGSRNLQSKETFVSAMKIQVGQVETKGKRHDKETKAPQNSLTRKPKISVLKPPNGSVKTRAPNSSTTTSCEIVPHSSKPRRTSVTSINLDGILHHSSSSEHRVVTQCKTPSNDTFGTDVNSHMTYKSETNVQLKSAGRQGIASSSTTVDKSRSNERFGSSHFVEDRTDAAGSGTSDEKEEFPSKEIFGSFQTQTFSSVTRESRTYSQSYHRNEQITNGRSEGYTNTERETRQSFHSFQNDRHQFNRKPGSVASDLSENLQDEKLSPKFSSRGESNDQKSSLGRSNSLLSESSPNSQKPNRERSLETKHKQVTNSSSKETKRSSEIGLCKEFNTCVNESQVTTENKSKETRNRLSRKDQLRVAMDWQHKLQLQVETLSWKYKSLEVEYNFLEKLIAEQREDLTKAKDWAKHAKETPARVESLTYCLVRSFDSLMEQEFLAEFGKSVQAFCFGEQGFF